MEQVQRTFGRLDFSLSKSWGGLKTLFSGFLANERDFAVQKTAGGKEICHPRDRIVKSTRLYIAAKWANCPDSAEFCPA